jgi:hypothetical protein
MAQFMLLLHETPADFADLSAEEIGKVIREYTGWADKLRSEGRLVGSNKLKDDGGRSLTAPGGKLSVVDGPYAEAKEVVGGYFIVEAAGYDEAVALSKDCPHLKYGGRIELRQVDSIHDPA